MDGIVQPIVGADREIDLREAGDSYAEPQQEIISEVKLTLNVRSNGKRTFNIPYFGIGIALLIFGVISLIIKLRKPIRSKDSWSFSTSEK
jgi:hypothetical protein